MPSLAMRLFDAAVIGRRDLRAMTHEEIAAYRDARVPVDVPLLGGVLDWLLGPPHPDVTTSDQTVTGADGDLPARVHTPRLQPRGAPLVVHLHGGGWVLNRPRMYDGFCSIIAGELGATVVSIDYRKAPEHPAPAAVDDAIAATRALLDEAPSRFGTGGHAAVVGDSAGGNLATLVALDRRGDERLRAQWLLYPGVDLARTFPSHQRFTDALILPEQSIEEFIQLYLDGADPTDPHVSPWYVDDVAGSAPALVQVAELDPLVDEGRAWAERLRDAGVETRLTTYVDQPHGFHALPGLAGQPAAQATAEGLAFLRRHLATPGT